MKEESLLVYLCPFQLTGFLQLFVSEHLTLLFYWGSVVNCTLQKENDVIL